jgi:glycosyltransferase 2 family protein
MKFSLRCLFFSVSVGFMIWILIRQWKLIQSTSCDVNLWYLGGSCCGILVLFFFGAYGWHLILIAMKQTIPTVQSLSIWILSSLTRYLPGGVWSYMSRVALAKEQGINIGTSSISLYLEMLLLMTSSLAVGIPALLLAVDIPIRIFHAMVIWLVLGLLMHPKSISLLRFLPGKIGKGLGSVSLPNIVSMIGLYIYYIIYWILFGFAFICFIYAIYPLPIELWLYTGSAFAFAFFVGFIIAFVPGGIGIREASLYFLLIGFLPDASCLFISGGSRLWIMFGEGVCILVVFIWRRSHRGTMKGQVSPSNSRY